jgi:aspartate racemase
MPDARIGLIGGISWESTSSYYRYFNEMFNGGVNEWSQPSLVIDSIDFGAIVTMQQQGDWDGTGAVLADSARRLEQAGATVLGIGANTMHINFDVVQAAVSIPVIDVRDAIAREVLALGHSSIALLGTKYLIDKTFYSDRLAALGVDSIRPSPEQADRLQRIIFDELTRSVVTNESRKYLKAVAVDCLNRGAQVVGLCCTEFGLLMNEEASFPVIDSTRAHVRALLRALGSNG